MAPLFIFLPKSHHFFSYSFYVYSTVNLFHIPIESSIFSHIPKDSIIHLFYLYKVHHLFAFVAFIIINCSIVPSLPLQMRIPTEHFSNIPVQMLTPQALSPREDDEDMSLPRSILSRLTVSI